MLLKCPPQTAEYARASLFQSRSGDSYGLTCHAFAGRYLVVQVVYLADATSHYIVGHVLPSFLSQVAVMSGVAVFRQVAVVDDVAVVDHIAIKGKAGGRGGINGAAFWQHDIQVMGFTVVFDHCAVAVGAAVVVGV